MRRLRCVAAVLVLLRAGAASSGNATCGGSWRPGGGLVLVYVVGAARSLAANAPSIEALFCGSRWAGTAAVVPLLHAWEGSACGGGDAAVPAAFGGGLTNATMDDMPGGMRALVAREGVGTDEHRRALAYVAQLFHVYNLNGRALRLLAAAGLAGLAPADPGRGVVVRWRPDATVRDAPTTRRFLGACLAYVRATPGTVCVLPTAKSRQLPARCLGRHRNFHVATCCHPRTSGILSDWVFVAEKRVLDGLDGRGNASAAALFAGPARTEHRLCETFIGAGLSLAWPAGVVDGGADQLGLSARRCPGNATATPFHEITRPAR